MVPYDDAPSRPRLLTMGWERLAFLHWPVDPAVLRDAIPPALELDTFEGRAYLGVVPFAMERTRVRWAPAVPTTASFLELNLRTYVRHGSRAGVWFFSLDAASWLAVRGARATFALPYFDARMSLAERAEGWIDYASERTHAGAPPARFRGAYRATGPPITAAPGTLEHFLTERYSLFAARGWGVDRSLRGGLLRGDIEHVPWPLRSGEARLEVCDMFELARWSPSAEERLAPPLVHVVDRIDVLAGAPRRVADA